MKQTKYPNIRTEFSSGTSVTCVRNTTETSPSGPPVIKSSSYKLKTEVRPKWTVNFPFANETRKVIDDEFSAYDEHELVPEQIQRLETKLDNLMEENLVEQSCFDRFKLDSEWDIFGRALYIKECGKCETPVINQIVAQLENENLQLKHYALTTRDSMVLCGSLKENLRVTSLDLSDTNINYMSMKQVAILLRENNFIVSLNLSQNEIGSQGLYFLQMALKECNELTQIILSDCKLKDQDGLTLENIIKMAKRLKRINLSHNALENKAISCITRAVSHHSNLKSLDLCWNHFKETSAISIATLLKQNTPLKRLNLSWTGLSNAGVHLILEAVQRNSRLNFLDLSHTRTNSLIAPDLVQLLRVNNCLKTLKFNGNNLMVPELLTILNTLLLKPSMQLQTLEIDTVELSEQLDELRQQISRQHCKFQLKLRYSKLAQT